MNAYKETFDVWIYFHQYPMGLNECWWWCLFTYSSLDNIITQREALCTAYIRRDLNIFNVVITVRSNPLVMYSVLFVKPKYNKQKFINSYNHRPRTDHNQNNFDFPEDILELLQIHFTLTYLHFIIIHHLKTYNTIWI